MTTSYSGAGFYEATMQHLSEGLGGIAPTCWHATEIDPGCRRILLSHRKPPQHLFADVCDRFPKHAIEKMKLVQGRYLEDLELRRRSLGPCRKSAEKFEAEVKTSLTSRFLELLRAILEEEPLIGTQSCYRCQQDCSIELPPVEQTGPEASCLHVMAAGSTCVDFSAMSKQPMKVMGQHIVPFLCWIREVQLCMPDLIFHECVRGHPSQQLFDLFVGSTHFVWSGVVTPHRPGISLHTCQKVHDMLEEDFDYIEATDVAPHCRGEAAVLRRGHRNRRHILASTPSSVGCCVGVFRGIRLVAELGGWGPGSAEGASREGDRVSKQL